ncbi:hypothetical protein Pint_07377 [Pistacia integerrima]|uniref:Uncharacterized protein n=1 Tax=Pistacia integerrima TaxID=434235 RepID=A0ACC0Y0T7_9ROSI|nr:hypothetical protein Pint_07377 [Pistacia integerrima]
MASTCCVNSPMNVKANSLSPSCSTKPKHILATHLSFATNNASFSLNLHENPRFQKTRSPKVVNFQVVASSAKTKPLKIMISGAPASGKDFGVIKGIGVLEKLEDPQRKVSEAQIKEVSVMVKSTSSKCYIVPLASYSSLSSAQTDSTLACTNIHTQPAQYGLVHIAAGDLLRAEIASGSENGKRAKEYMEKGQLVPDEIVVMMVKERLSQPDSLEKGWLLDGYPRSSSQATAVKKFGFQPDLFILLEVSEDILVERVVGRRLDPVTGKIYHLKYSPPETEEIAARLTQRFDDTEEKA